MSRLAYVPILALVGFAWSIPCEASTIAYWRFEDGIAGGTIPGSADRTVPVIGTIDYSGNGNHLFAFNDTWASHQWSSNVPSPTVPQTGEANNLSSTDSSNDPGMFTWAAGVAPTGVNLQAWTSATWTIEASFNRRADGDGYRTIVGRDGNGTHATDAALAPLYFQTIPDGRLAVKFNDVMGNQHSVFSTVTIDADRWYHAAAISDGTTLSLYLNSGDGNGYVLQESIALVTEDARIASAGSDFLWSVGRGWFDGGDVDRWRGLIDEVRISDVALSVDQLLFSVPEPASLLLLTSGALLLTRRCNR